MSTTFVYLFAILCATATAQYDDLSILEEVLDRSTLPTVEIEPEVTVESGIAPSSTAGPTVPEVSTTTPESTKHTTKTTKMENGSSGRIDEIAPLVTTPVVEPSESSSTGSPMTTPTRIRTSTKPKSENSTTQKISSEDKAEIPLVEKEPIIGMGKPDLSRIYRRLFPYRNI